MSARSHFPTMQSPCTFSQQGESAVFSNEYISWIFNRETGQLTGAKVHYGTNENLLGTPLTAHISVAENGTNVVYTAGELAESVKFTENSVERTCPFAAGDGKTLKGIVLQQTITIGEWGDATCKLAFRVTEPVTNVNAVRPVLFSVKDHMTFLGIRHRHINGTGYWTQHCMQWTKLGAGKLFTDPMPYLSNGLPLTMLLLKPGTEGIQLEMGDDIAAWSQVPGYQEGMLLYLRSKKSYEIRQALFMDMPGQTMSKDIELSFRLSMPFVKKNIVPLRRASSVIRPTEGFDKLFPDNEFLAKLENAGYDMLRFHLDADRFKTGIFWRDAVYPPFPPEYMKKLDQFIADSHTHGINVVPYFSVKEMHPVAPWYKDHSMEWARQQTEGYGLRVSEYGSVMCLASGWEQVRRETIKQVLDNHDFDGTYYDWAAGLECCNSKHSEKAHWDNDRLLDFLKWTADSFKDQNERYQHYTYVASYSHENTASMVICEEKSFPETGFEMFTPHVHFVNIAPRQICEILPASASDADRRRLAMCALLHHASVSSVRSAYLDFYAELDWLDSVTEYEKHAAPGEGIIASGNENVGFSIYWNRNDGKMMIVAANLSDSRQKAGYKITIPERNTKEGTLEVPPMSVIAVKID